MRIKRTEPVCETFVFVMKHRQMQLPKFTCTFESFKSRSYCEKMSAIWC